MLLTKTAGVPGAPPLTAICTIVSLPVFATNKLSPALLNARPFAPNGGTPAVASSGSVTHATAAPPPGPVFQTMPWNESDTYTLPLASKVRAFSPALPAAVMKTDDDPSDGFTLSTRALPPARTGPKSITSRSPVVG